MAKFRLKLKKVGRTTRPKNQIIYDYKVEVINRFKGLALIGECLKNYRQFHNIVQEVVIKTTPKKKKCNKVI